MLINITPETRERWNNAFTKAAITRPRIYTLSFGKFEVEGAQDYYIVDWASGQPKCNCLSGIHDAPCYHAASTDDYYNRQLAERANRPTPYDYVLRSLEEAKAAMEEQRAAWLAQCGGFVKVVGTEKEETGASAECHECGKAFPEAAMTGPGYALVCDDCRSARSTTISITWVRRPGRFKEDE